MDPDWKLHQLKKGDAPNLELTTRAEFFRDKLIEEFRLVEDSFHYNAADIKAAPKFTTSDLFPKVEDQAQDKSDVLKKVLISQPHQLVKFKIFKRSQGPRKNQVDKRLIRVKNIDKVPIGVYANWVVEHPVFQNLVVFLIVANAISQGIQLSTDRSSNPTLDSVLDQFDNIILIVFMVEIILKLVDHFFDFWLDPWNIFDFVVTILSAIPVILSLMSASRKGTLAQVANQLRVFRTLRSLKMIAKINSLRVVIQTVVEAFQSLGFILLLLSILMYIFAIFAVNLFEPYSTSSRTDLQYQNKWDNLLDAFKTLFQLLTLDQWYNVQDDMQKVVTPWVVILFFIVWVWIGAFVFRNVFVGVMVKKFDEMNRQVKQKMEAEKTKKQFDRDVKLLNKELQNLKEREPSLTKPDKKPDKNLQLPQNEKSELESWQITVRSTLDALRQKKTEYLWPRDALFQYLQSMEKMQENMKEYLELQFLAASALYQVYDS
eukprot:TRINITY_DN11197_c0_g1_i3.p1 TRINITY_DN11197_c0_g1~~TRINITY_DN11197_c0_g1_i3.p1  ORF type:complete len:488 (-),score=60.15 TRINITY_DN11197_c0_g1_i3:162-1625(-)